MKPYFDKNFWPSFSDLMTSLFFIMLVLFAMSLFLYNSTLKELNDKNVILADQKKRLLESEKQVNKYKEIEKSIKNISPEYFKYIPTLKKHILNISIQFTSGAFEVNALPQEQRQELKNAGNVIRDSLLAISKREKEVQFLLIIEGQASNIPFLDQFGRVVPNNAYLCNEISYHRALSLKEYWLNNGLILANLPNCELIVAGSGVGGLPRDTINDKNNQRFFIYIIPKTGELK